MDKTRASREPLAPDGRSKVTVLLVEDDAMVREWITAALGGSEFGVGAVAATAAEGIELTVRHKPELVLTDYRLPDRPGTELVRELRLRGFRVPTVVMTANEERGLNELAREAGAQGTVLKGGSEALVETLRLVKGGGQVFDARHPKRRSGQVALSPRERAVLQLVAGGQTNVEIAQALEIGPETVKTLVQRTFQKLGARRRAEAVAAAHELGLL
ncbi:MAG: response regulator [Gaiellaceae bacterium]